MVTDLSSDFIVFLIILVTVSLIAGLLILYKQFQQKGKSIPKKVLPVIVIVPIGFCGFLIGMLTNMNLFLWMIIILSFILIGVISYIVINIFIKNI